MKTAISIPDATFQAAEELAKRLGMSRSRLVTAAVQEFIEKNANVTEALNRVYACECSKLDPVLAQMQVASLQGDAW